MNSPVTQRFIECHERLKLDRRIRSSRQFAQSLDYLPQSLSEILKCRRDVTIELLRKAVDKYRMNPRYLLTGEGSMFLTDEDNSGTRVLAVVTSPDNDERIVHVPVPAQAGYPAECADPGFVAELPSFGLPDPQYRSGTYRSFDVAGDSMEPTLWKNDKLVCRFVEPPQWGTSLKKGDLYVVVTANGVLAKRMGELPGDRRSVVLVSDNPHYKPQEIPFAGIREIWQARTKISSAMQPPGELERSLLSEIQFLRQQMDEQRRLADNLHQTIEMLMAQK